MAGTDVPVALVRLEAKGVKGATGDTVVAKIAAQANVPAARVYEIIANNLAKSGPGEYGPGGGGGLGNKTLVQFCADEGIEVAVAVERLAAKGFKVEPTQTLRELAVFHGFSRPFELIEIVRGTAK